LSSGNYINIKMFKISVIIATYNRCESLKDTLNSLLKQKVNEMFDYEIIVVDNNSNDRTREVVEEFKNKFNRKLKYIFEPRQGKPYALNRGIKETEGDVFAFTDDDCIVDRDWCLEIFKTFSQNPQISFIQGRVVPIYLAKLPEWYQEGEWFGEKYTKGIFKLKDNTVDGANMIISRKAVDILKGFNPFFSRAEDTEIGYKAKNKGIEIYYVSKIKVKHKMDKNKLKKIYWLRCAFICGKKYPFIDNSTPAKNIYGIPLWIFRDILNSILKYLKFTFLLNPKKSLNKRSISHFC